MRHSSLYLLLVLLLAACGTDAPTDSDSPESTGVVNLYSHRHYDVDKELYEEFEELYGIEVNVVKAGADELLNRLETEGERSPADLIVTVDAGRLQRAKEKGLLQATTSDTISLNVPSRYRDPEGEWVGLTRRARVVVYSKERVQREELGTYSGLTDPKWKGKVLVRSSDNIYNQSLLASMIAHDGEAAARTWAEGVVANFARSPKGNDRDQVKAIAQGIGDVAIVNTYYIGKLLGSDDAAEREAGEAVGVVFPTNGSYGTHVNVSGIAITRHAPNRDNALKLVEFLTSEAAQQKYAAANYEYPVNLKVQPSELLQSWGDFVEDDLPLPELGKHNREAVMIFDEVEWP